jgi:alanine-glyoxylate transaminase / serine-glyoxylate transaminase / serine-pyruvate transaminase
MAFEPLKLMVPGPIQPADEVLEAMGSPVQAHYGPAWTRYYTDTLDLLGEVYQTRGDVFLMVGSGTVAIDAGMGSVLSTGEKILIGINGFFGERLQTVAESYGLQVVRVEAAWGEALRAQDFEAALRENPDARAVFVVHLETSTTVINPVEEIGAVCRRHGAVFMVDAVSSLGGIPMRMDDWGIDVCVSCAQKCLGAPPGLAPLAVSPRAWEAIDSSPVKNHGWYSDLRTWRWYATSPDWANWHPSPITMATNNVMALRVGLESLLAEGIATRLERYCRLAYRLRDGLRRIGMRPYTPDERMAPVLTAAYGPAGIPTGKIIETLAEDDHIKIAGGLGLLKDQIIRIGHMSPTTSEADMDEVLEALERAIHKLS